MSLYIVSVMPLVCSQQKLEINDAFSGDSEVLFLTWYVLGPSVFPCEQLRFTC